MAYRIDQARAPQRPRVGRIALVVSLVVVLFGARSMASYAIEVAWWKELGQFDTWLSMLYYSLAPVAIGTVLAFGILWITHARALKFAETSLRDHKLYARLSALVLLLLSYIIAASNIDTWTVVRFTGSRNLTAAATGWHDTVFNKPLSFYLFDLPFYSMLRGYVLALVIVSILLYWIAARAWQLRYKLSDMQQAREIDPAIFRLEGGLESRFLRGAAVFLLMALAVRFFLGRYEMVYDVHSTFLVGVDYVDLNIGLPMQWLLILACFAASGLLLAGRWIAAASMALALVVAFVVPKLVSSLYVQPNEISLQQPFIESHIHATRSAYGLEKHVDEIEFSTDPDGAIDTNRNKALLDNVRLWDDQAFHDTITQLQALRTYYVFHAIDVDRYTIDGQYRQVLLTSRELDVSKLPDAANWINPAFIYTHGYGLVLSEVSKTTSDGLPELMIKDAPPKVETTSIKLTRPEIYYGEVTHEPVFVNTAEKEFNYPSGETQAEVRYEGAGGFPIDSLAMRLAAALSEAEPNILLTNYYTPKSRMMIHRKVRERVQELAPFLAWDQDPYLVITDSGRLIWMIDGYTTSDAHPYSRSVEVSDMGSINYIRNAVKATVDAYDGETHFYIFAPDDPIIGAYRNLFPQLFLPAAAMPADLRRHARYPETLFSVQAEIYRTFHMLDPRSFYNKEDVWELAQHSDQSNGSSAVTPTYLMATLPGEDKPEFLLMLPFTPRSKNNLIGLMMARCDGAHLGETVVLLLSKQKLINGPMNIDALINQDQNISKDLSLWGQQGSHVLRGQVLILPMGNTFLYVDPIYIQASAQGSMPQLKKVVLAVGSKLIYSDTYDQALAQLSSGAQELIRQSTAASAPPAAGAAPSTPPSASTSDQRLARVRDHLRRYRELAAQGKWADAGKELEAIEAEVKQ